MTKKHKDELIQCGNTLPSAHITKDQFCNWQEGKLEGAKDRSLHLLCGTIWELDGRRGFRRAAKLSERGGYG